MIRLKPAWWTNWHTDAARFLACCLAGGAILGGVLGAISDRRGQP